MNYNHGKYVLDTHALIWYLAGDKKLGLKAREIICEIEQGKATGYISVIVLAEMIFSFQKRNIFFSIEELIGKLKDSNFRVVVLDIPQIISLQTITEIPEMHDRIMVALALQENARLVTKDREIIDSKLVEVVW